MTQLKGDVDIFVATHNHRYWWRTFMVWNIPNNQRNLTVGSFCRPPNSGIKALDQLKISLSRFANNSTSMIILAGDFNLPDISWNILTTKQHCWNTDLHTQLLDIVNDLSLTQHKRNNILDLLLTNTPNLVNRVEVRPGISDHQAICTEVNTNPIIN